MKKQIAALLGVSLIVCLALAGCHNSEESSSSASSPSSTPSSSQLSSPQAGLSSSSVNSVSSSGAVELIVHFGDDGEPFTMHLEENSTAAAIAGYVGTTEWRLPVYSHDESDVMEYYDIPSRYEIPDNSETVTIVHAGDVFYSDPNRIVLYYHDAQIDEEYTKIGTFEATEEFISAVENNPVLEGWGNQIVRISDGE